MANRSVIVMEGFLLQARNIYLFIPIFLVVVAYTTLSTSGYSTVVEPVHAIEARIRTGRLVTAGTAYLLIMGFTVGPAVVAITVSAAVTVCSGERRSSFYALVRKLPAAAGLMKGPYGTALLGHVLQAAAWRVVIMVFELYTAFYFRYPSSAVLLNKELPLFLLGHIVTLYVEVVCTLAVVVSVAEPAGCFYGARALRQSWWIMANKTTPAVILLFVKGMGNAVMKRIYIRVRFVYSINQYYTVGLGYGILPRFVYITLYAGLQVWFVCATTVYYYRCRQRKDDSHYCRV